MQPQVQQLWLQRLDQMLMSACQVPQPKPSSCLKEGPAKTSTAKDFSLLTSGEDLCFPCLFSEGITGNKNEGSIFRSNILASLKFSGGKCEHE